MFVTLNIYRMFLCNIILKFIKYSRIIYISWSLCDKIKFNKLKDINEVYIFNFDEKYYYKRFET